MTVSPSAFLERLGRLWGSSPEHTAVARGDAITGKGTMQKETLQTQMNVKRRRRRHS